MKIVAKKVSILVAIVFVLGLLYSQAEECPFPYRCNEIWENMMHCSSPDGCVMDIAVPICTFGCYCSSCQTNYGLCCNKQYTAKSLAPMSGNCGVGCGAVVAPQTAKDQKENPERKEVGVKEVLATLIYIPDRCANNYGEREVGRPISSGSSI